ncbi:MAG TPA: hypothetical protein ENJ09_05835 [Planctomycetes bacterium]|nr:hypothetical protein [Planctomycetota bacterium]
MRRTPIGVLRSPPHLAGAGGTQARNPSHESMLVTAALLVFQTIGPAGGSPPPHPKRLLVKLAPDATPSAWDRILDASGCSERLFLPQIRWAVVDAPAGTLARTRALLEANPAVERVSFDRARRRAYVPNDPLWSQMWQLTQIRADDAWDTTRGNAAVVVAVLDTGLETSHSDIASNLWVNTGETAGNGIDDDGNGYIDDVNGYDFVALDGTPEDVNGHGTEVAGISSAVQDNMLGITGAAPLCPVAALKAGDDSGMFYDSAIVPALVYAADMGFRVAVLSFSGDAVTAAEKDAVEYAHDHGVLLVAAAGNDASVFPFYPAAYDDVLAVAATQDSTDKRAFFTNHGSWVDVAAPGYGIRTTATGDTFVSNFSGTSGSAPYVAGVGALLFSLSPNASVDRVRAAIEDSSVLLQESGYGYWSNYGRVDSQAALDHLTGMSSGPVDARLSFVAPSGGGLKFTGGVSGPPPTAAGPLPRVVLHGVGLERPARLVVRANGRSLPVPVRGRKRAEFAPLGIRGGSRLSFERDGVQFDSLVWERANGLLYTVSDAGSKSGGAVQGGFKELYRNDGVLFTCTRNPASKVFIEAIVRGIEDSSFTTMILEATRSYTNAGGATETIELYDWSSGSYPGGSWVTISTRTLPASPTTEDLRITVPAPATRFLDDTGTVYLRITANPVGFGGVGSFDRLRLLVR